MWKVLSKQTSVKSTQGEVIQERNRLNVVFVTNDLHTLVLLLATAQFTVDRNLTSVMSVTRRLKPLTVYLNT